MEDDDREERPAIPRSLTEVMNETSSSSLTSEPSELEYNPSSATLADLGYEYNDKGELRLIANKEEKFKFADQRHYDLLGTLVVKEIQRRMVDLGSKELWVPFSPAEDEPRCNVFASNDFTTNRTGLVVIICGSGAVRAGQFARSLCINDSLNTGSVLPYMKLAQIKGYSHLVLNPNYNRDPATNLPIRGSETPEKHVEYCWKTIISKSPASKIAIVAHSYGGICTVSLLDRMATTGDKSWLAEDSRIKAIAFTDSAHPRPEHVHKLAREFLLLNAVNWIASTAPLDTRLGKRRGCQTVSSGHPVHEHTSASAMNSVFAFIHARFNNLHIKESNCLLM